jgi:hypothetical protein
MSCPNKCSNDSSFIFPNRATKFILNGLRIKCQFGCEIEFLSFEDHDNEIHKYDIRCWNCNNNANSFKIKQINEVNAHSLLKEIDELKMNKTNFEKKINELTRKSVKKI